MIPLTIGSGFSICKTFPIDSENQNQSQIEMRRTALVVGNWKLHGSRAMVKQLAESLNASNVAASERMQVGVAPSAVHLSLARGVFRPEIMVGAQDCWREGSGAFTGETSADMLSDLGIEFCIIGHSERREKGEDDSIVGLKAAYAISQGLTVIGCIGEKLEQREGGETMDMLTRQMEGYLTGINDAEHWKDLVIAYEPIWAIGTGKTATPEQAEEVHGKLREWIRKNVGSEIAREIRILYGGSVNAKNCDDLIKKQNIDGFLVGGASLKPEFVEICRSLEKNM